MLTKAIRFCVSEAWLVVVVAACLAAFGWWCFLSVPIDAIPNVGENQVIVLTNWPGRSPKDVEDQITYPLSSVLLATPGAESVRGKSMFGYSFVQVTFEDGVDFYWARSRVSEQLDAGRALLPEGVTPQLGPDATGLGQILYYVLEPPPDGRSLAELRSLQDYVLKYELQAVEGVSEVASIGGYVQQYQIEVDPDRLRFYGVTLDQLLMAVRGSNLDVGAKTAEASGMEYIVRSKGFVGGGAQGDALIDLEQTVVVQRDGVPVRLRDVAQVQIGPDFRRGALDYNGSEAVGGIVVMRFGANPRAVIDAVKQRISELAPSLDGVGVNPVYDRTGLIDETVTTLSESLRDETLITVVVIVLFLLHVRASFVVAITLPLAVVMSFIGMWGFGIDANIMSLAGIAIAIGEVADLAIIVSENIYQHLVDWRNKKGDDAKQTRAEVIIAAAAEVAPAVVTAVSTTVISFMPVFFLTGRDYKLFAPLAYTKTFAMLAALVAAVLLTPALCRLLLDSGRWSRRRSLFVATAVGAISATVAAAFWRAGFEHMLPWGPVWGPIALGFAGGAITYIGSREQLRSVDENPTSRAILFIYEPLLRFLLSHKGLFALAPATLMVLGLGAWIGLPTVLRPAETVAEWLGVRPNELPGYVDLKHTFTGLRSDDWIALDEGSWFYMPTLYPAAGFGQAMQVLQTQDILIRQIPEVADVLGKIGRAESALDPAPAEMIETYVMLKPVDEWREGVTARDVWDEINAAATLPGVTPASPLQPIEGRVVMLQAGIKAPMAVRIYGDRLSDLADAALAVADQLRKTPYVNPTTVNPDIVLGKPYVEFEVDREAAARYGMSVEEVNTVVEVALGGKNLITTVEGRERYPVRLRYRRDIREGIDELGRLPVVAPTGEVVPLEELATIGTSWGPGAISSENARLVAHVAFSPGGQTGDLETVRAVEESLAAALRSDELTLPAGYTWEMVGSFQNQIEANRRLLVIIPLVVVANLLLIYLQFRSLPLALIIFSQIPVAFAGGMIGVAIADVEINTAVWIGFIALFGISVDDGVVIATYMEQLFMRRKIESVADLREATVEAGKRRIRPCLMTAFTTFAALTPVMLADGRGADVAQAMALPVFAGMFIEMISLFVVPVFYCGFMEMKLRGGFADTRWQAHPEMAAPP